MNRDELLALCRKARDVGAVKHEEFRRLHCRAGVAAQSGQ